MKRVLFLLLTLALLLPLATQAQTWSPEQQEVWKVVADSWVAETERDATWYEQFVHPSFHGWTMDTPHPRDYETAKGWNRFSWETSENLMYSLHPLAMVVEGNTAIVYYYYSTASEDEKGERETTHHRQVETLIQESGTWKFLGWLGGDEVSGVGG